MHEYYYTIIVEYSNQGTKRLDSFVTPFTNERTSQECRPRSACQDQIKWFQNRFQRTFFAGNFIILLLAHVYTRFGIGILISFLSFSEIEANLYHFLNMLEISGFIWNTFINSLAIYPGKIIGRRVTIKWIFEKMYI